jgi:hypothetical protein
MHRKSFIQHLATLGAFGFLPLSAFKHYQKYYLLQCFVAGFRFYKGLELLNEMKEGDQLELVREPDNEYDNSAIALHWNNHKIGFLPAGENELLSRLLDAKALELTAEITHLNKAVKPWENLCVAIYFLKEAHATSINSGNEYLTRLDTPHYTSFKNNNETIMRVEYSNNESENDTDWYSYFVKHSKNDSIYSIIHGSDVKPDYDYGSESGEYMLINKNRLPATDVIQNLLRSIDPVMNQLDNLFEKNGYIVVTTKQAEALVPQVQAIVNVTDKLGRHFIELVLQT